MPPLFLTPTQQTLLAHAIDVTHGQIQWFPEGVHGGARHKVLTALAARSLITLTESTWKVTEAGYLCMERPLPLHIDSECSPQFGSNVELQAAVEPNLLGEDEVEVAPPEPASCPESISTTPRSRANSKQAQVLALLQRPEGATISQICELTQWLSHTVRGALAGTFKKKLGLTITSEKPADGERIYRCGQINESA
jgi:hypothetical protein